MSEEIDEGDAIAEAKAAEIDALSWEELDAYGQRIEEVTSASGQVFRVKSLVFWDIDEWESDLYVSVKVYAPRGWRKFWPHKARRFRGGETVPHRTTLK
jgi:hypothetical protein